METKTLSPELLHKMDAYWRAANYLSVGQIYLYDNPLSLPTTLSDRRRAKMRTSQCDERDAENGVSDHPSRLGVYPGRCRNVNQQGFWRFGLVLKRHDVYIGDAVHRPAEWR